MQFHDDGEKELGPTVATLSLGASATMDFRPKAKGPVGEFRGPNQSNSKGKKKKPVMLSITLDHGDLIVMHGQEIQKYYEVSFCSLKVIYGMLKSTIARCQAPWQIALCPHISLC